LVTEVLGESVSSIFKSHTVQEEHHYSWTAFWLYTQLLLGGVWGVDEPVNAAVGINAIYFENKMKHTLPNLLYITAGGIYKYH